MEKILQQFKSRRNRVSLLQTKRGPVVQKTYLITDCCLRELQVYEKLRDSDLPHVALLDKGESWIWLQPVQGYDLVSILEEQETSGQICWDPWRQLVFWLVRFEKITGLVMADLNLRNFLYASEDKTLYGLDFEECTEGSLVQTAALLTAYILHYAPEETPVKRKIAEYVLHQFSEHLHADMRELLLETKKQEAFLLSRRKSRR